METNKRFCDFCDSKGVTHKKTCTRDVGIAITPKPATEVTLEFVKTNEFNEFKSDTKASLDLILDKLTDKKAPKLDSVAMAEAEPLDTQPMFPKFKAVVIKYFDPEDNFKIIENYPDRNRITVNVPQKFSNATSAHWTLVGVDQRSSSPIKESGDQYYEEVEKFLKKVVTQLHYDRNAVVK